MENLYSYRAGLRLGIDTGGTYTDAVLVNSSDEVVASNKSLTTQYDLTIGIEDVLARLPQPLLHKVGLVSLSTTLATNAIVEGHGASVGLLLAGYNPTQIERSNIKTAVRNGLVVSVDGSYDAIGNETIPLDLENAKETLQSWRTKVSAIGISGIFSVRNPTHELTLRKLAETYTDLPITCGHELASLLDAPRRAVTVAINASLIPFIAELICSVRTIIKKNKIVAPLMVVKGDGSLVKAEIALERPVETVMSGPAASVIGACHLGGNNNSIVADMGGTTTDISVVNNGRFHISEHQSSIGGWRPMVETIQIVSAGLGGDSEAHYKGGQGLTLGPRRVIPMSLLGHQYPHVLQLLDAQLASDATARSNRFALRLHATEQQIQNFSNIEHEVWEQLGEGPLEMEALSKHSHEQAKAVATLLRKRVVIYSGFTPSDAAHVLRYTNHWSREAAEVSAQIWAKQMRYVYGWGNFDTSDIRIVSNLVHKEVSRKISQSLIRATLAIDNLNSDSYETWAISDVLSSWVMQDQELQPRMFSVQFDKSIKLVAVGAPAHLYYPQISKSLGIGCEIPPNAQVANAVGAVVGSIVQRVKVTITQPAQGTYRVYDDNGPTDFNDLEDAILFAKAITERRASLNAEYAGATDIAVSTNENRTSVNPDDFSSQIFFESVITSTATGRPSFK